MKARHKRFLWIGAAVALLAIAVTLVLGAFNDNLVFFKTPTEVAEGLVPKGRNFRVGGMVEKGSIQRAADGLTVSFVLTDTVKSIPITYKGALPDLFKDGKGAVAQGKLDESGKFIASEVLAKHDENYMPSEAQEAIDRAKATAAHSTKP
ncbi:cytochrome c maturation protein CcmE [Uliginosibacterium sp. H3]|uniref:Cytochrome c-type biogenesis protein CcmE n=1 Tax=Uliginosibacterium silvisoli TaxID=3114758 RepID=A0ABU6K7I8_9RHOO|nr:cytochrome c maturation protein CcmE [Uliginosibacterium sp. H3]